MVPAARRRPPSRAEGNVLRPAVDVGRMRLLGDVESLCQVAREGDSIAAGFALEALDDLGDPAAIETYMWCLGTLEESVSVLAAAALALGNAREQRALPRLIALLDRKHSDSGIVEDRQAAATALGSLRDPDAVPSLLASLDHFVIAPSALSSLAAIGGTNAVEGLLTFLYDRPGYAQVICTLGEIGDRRAVPTIAEILLMRERLAVGEYDEDHRGTVSYRYRTPPQARRAAAVALGCIGGEDVIEPLLEALRDPDEQTAVSAAEALGCTAAALPRLTETLGASESIVRSAACGALGAIGDRAAVPALARVLAEDPTSSVRSAAAAALGHLGGTSAREALLIALEDPLACVAAASALALLVDDPPPHRAAQARERDPATR